MNTEQRVALSVKLTEASRLIGELQDSLIRGLEPRQLLRDTDELHNRAAEALAFVVGLVRQPNELPFVGANVQVGVEVDDRGAQAEMARKANAHADERQRVEGAA